MYSSSEDSDSDSGTNFKRGKRKPKEETPPPAKVTYVEANKSSHRSKRDETSRRQMESNGDTRGRVSHERSRHKPEASSSKDVRPKSGDKLDRGEARDDRHKREEVKKKRIRSRSRDYQHHRPPSPKQRNIEDRKKTNKIRALQSKQPSRSHSNERSRHQGHSSSQKESKERGSSSRHVQEKTRSSIESKRRSSHDTSHASYGPALPPPSRASTKNDAYMPTEKKARSRSPRRYIGPSLPKDYRELLETRAGNYDDIISSDDEECTIGPMPTSVEMELSQRDLELEKRKIEIKLQQLDRQREAVTNKDVKYREEWMLELPEVRRVGDVGVTNRQFRKNDRPDFSDRTDWTKTPNDEHKKPRHDQRKLDEDKKRQLEIKRRDEEQEKMAKEHKKSHKRDKSLLEIHEKKLKKEKKKLKDEKKERRPFNRDSDLSINKFDDARKKALCKKAQLLDTRFSSGNKKYL